MKEIIKEKHFQKRRKKLKKIRSPGRDKNKEEVSLSKNEDS